MRISETNLRIIKSSRRKPEAGDIFRMKLHRDDFLFGRVMAADITDRNLAPMPGSYLIYVYRHRSVSPDPDRAQLTPSTLLLPPIFINRMPWTKGYFDTVESEPLSSKDWLSHHCFWSAARETFLDIGGNPLRRKHEPCGDWALSSYRWLDDKVSDAIGVPRAPGGE